MIRITDSREYKTYYVETKVLFDNVNIVQTYEDDVKISEAISEFDIETFEWTPEDRGYIADFSHAIVLSISRCRDPLSSPEEKLPIILKEHYEDVFNATFLSVEVVSIREHFNDQVRTD